jgi:hypothetical protein
MNAELHSLLIKYTDTQDLVGATIGEISFIVMLTSLGCLLGSSAVGLLMDMIRRSELYCGTGTYVNVIFLFNLYAHSFKVGMHQISGRIIWPFYTVPHIRSDIGFDLPNTGIRPDIGTVLKIAR